MKCEKCKISFSFRIIISLQVFEECTKNNSIMRKGIFKYHIALVRSKLGVNETRLGNIINSRR